MFLFCVQDCFHVSRSVRDRVRTNMVWRVYTMATNREFKSSEHFRNLAKLVILVCQLRNVAVICLLLQLNGAAFNLSQQGTFMHVERALMICTCLSALAYVGRWLTSAHGCMEMSWCCPSAAMTWLRLTAAPFTTSAPAVAAYVLLACSSIVGQSLLGGLCITQ